MILRSCILLLLATFSSPSSSPSSSSPSFTIDWGNNTFLKDGVPYRFISGGMHYFRVPRQYWKDRMYKMKLGGMNALQTYIAWNTHEDIEGTYQFSDDNDILLYLDMAKSMGLDVILRPGPYICAEWNFGGLPYWLLNKPGIKFRVYNKPYITAINTWFDVLLPKFVPYLYKNGGPIIAVQVENEYGGFGNVCDHTYLRFLLEKLQQYFGQDIVYYTVDNGNVVRLACGGLPGLLKTIDFGSNKIPHFQFAMLRKYMPKGPLVNTEFWSGWFDVWGGKHANVSGAVIAKRLDQILSLNASVNFYMFEGGTNFGYNNGAMSKDGYKYNVRVTSYDYDSPLTEAGDTTEKYWSIRRVMKRYVTLPPDPVPPHSDKWSSGKIALLAGYNVFDNLEIFSKCENHTLPITMEFFNQSQGFILYSLNWNRHITNISLYGVHDRALVYLDSALSGVITRPNGTITLSETLSVSKIQILLENMGRVNHGSYMGEDYKGLTKSVYVDGVDLSGNVWSVCPLPLEHPPLFLTDYLGRKTGLETGQTGLETGQTGLETGQTGLETGQTGLETGQTGLETGQTGLETGQTGLETGQTGLETGQTGLETGQTGLETGQTGFDETGQASETGSKSSKVVSKTGQNIDTRSPSLYTPTFYCAHTPDNSHNLDTFLDPRGWVKGVAYINGINLGRYWPNEGPQVTLYVPGVWFTPGSVVCLLELEKAAFDLQIQFINKPILSLPEDQL